MTFHISRLLWTATSVLACLMTGQVAADSPDDLIAAWVQYTADGVEARAVVTDDCPAIAINRRPMQMVIRAVATEAHPNTVCSIKLPAGTKSIWLYDQMLPAPKKRIRRLAIVGDTGCRVSDSHGLFQPCNIDSVWPFAQVATEVAADGPNVIIHTGDYIYRESPCPQGNTGCEGTPYGDTIDTWMAEWLIPAKPMFAAAPLVLVRGNHETCSRAGTGYFRYIGPRENPDVCPDSTDAWVAEIGDMQLGVLDSANLTDSNGNPLTDYFAQQLTDLNALLAPGSWLTAHHPFWGFGADDDTGEPVQYTDVLQAAVAEAGLPAGVELLLGSHIHLIEVLDFGGEAPPQIVVGNGGTQLVNRVPVPNDIAGMPIMMSKVLYQYGYATADLRNPNQRIFKLRDVEGRQMARCEFNGQMIKC